MTEKQPTWTQKRQQMTQAATRKLNSMGYFLEKIPERGLSNKWNYKIDGKIGKIAIRTTQDRWFAFPSLQNGWKTLDEVDLVVVVSVDSKDAPKRFEVYLFDAEEVRERFNKSRLARRNAGMTIRENYGMWVGLDKFDHTHPPHVGSGLGEKYPPIDIVNILLPDTKTPDAKTVTEPTDEKSTKSVANIVETAKYEISVVTSIPVEQISIELKFDY